jgi:peptidoglycan hydrolase CwlO-like protein
MTILKLFFCKYSISIFNSNEADLKILIGVLAVVVAILATAGGYKLGSGKLDKVQAERDEWIRKAKQSDTLVKNAQKTLDEKLAEQDRINKAKIAEMEAEAKRQKAELDKLLANAKARIEKQNAEIAKVENERKGIAEDLKTAKGKAAELLAKKDAELAARLEELKKVRDGLVCLEKPVPPNEIGVLNQARN